MTAQTHKTTMLVSCAILTALLVGTYLGSHFGREKTESKTEVSITDLKKGVLKIYSLDSGGTKVTQGSGFLIDETGTLVTNWHVLSSAASAEAEMENGRLYQVLILKRVSTSADLAVVRIGRRLSGATEWPADLPHLDLSTSEVAVGTKIVTIGSPEDLTNSVSDGIVSGIRNQGDVQLIQITSPVSPGSSGGPILNAVGEVVGVTQSQLTQGQNLNFAIASSEVTKLLAKADDPIDFDLFAELIHNPRKKARSPSSVKSDDSTQLSGTYTGSVLNETVNERADITLVSQEAAGLIFGCAIVQRPLYGSGGFVGTVTGDSVDFSVSGKPMTIDFVGHRNKQTLRGTYEVHTQGYEPQSGRFAFHRISKNSLPADFDISKCPGD